MISQGRAITLLVAATALWGFGFIATIWGLTEIRPLALTFLRFGLAAVILAPFAIRQSSLPEICAAIAPGTLLGFGLILQTLGLEHTTATKSGFLTTLYVLVVPFIELAVLRHRLRPRVVVAATIATLGTLLMASPRLTGIGRGDALTVACAVVFAFQIASISFVQKWIRSPWSFSFWQSAIAAALTLPFVEAWPGTLSWRGWGGLAWLAIGSSVLAFSFQIIAQRRLSASVSATLCLLEAPFAALFGWWLLGDAMGAAEWVGAVVVILAALLASRP